MMKKYKRFLLKEYQMKKKLRKQIRCRGCSVNSKDDILLILLVVIYLSQMLTHTTVSLLRALEEKRKKKDETGNEKR